MALELFSESWAGWPAPAPSPAAGASSPRISFSRDLDGSTSLDHDHHQHHHHLHRQQRSDSSLLDSSSPDFDFCVSRDRPEQEYSSAADELFSDGFLLPLPIVPRGAVAHSALPTRITTTPSSPSSSSSSAISSRPVRPLPTPQAQERKDSAEEISTRPGTGGSAEDKPLSGKQPSSFWKFGRSSSLNYSVSSSGAGPGSGGRRATLICSLPLLSRSKSTGSHPSTPTLKHRQQPFNSVGATTASSSSSGGGGGSKLSRKGSGNGGAAARNPYYYGQHHHGGGGVRISPVLNVPPPYIPKGSGAGLFSFGHLLCSSRERSRKKTTQQQPPPLHTPPQ